MNVFPRGPSCDHAMFYKSSAGPREEARESKKGAGVVLCAHPADIGFIRSWKRNLLCAHMHSGLGQYIPQELFLVRGHYNFGP